MIKFEDGYGKEIFVDPNHVVALRSAHHDTELLLSSGIFLEVKGTPSEVLDKLQKRYNFSSSEINHSDYVYRLEKWQNDAAKISKCAEESGISLAPNDKG